ncbi:DUF4386 domain-containing protein [Cellulomonas alba]|uniref:DUF4386 domain-containing protein n=1 Tax=Cellulomonas alba TaxID=3053467 RepID=A0ABT7SFJ1_9CELL|nr:DUF4386 domain-containing protein [Cellulomonas alba]MDM7854964.1 DUF4386 domain-containing protein [Cellulomonas alba]
MDATRRAARTAGALYLLTFVASIPAVALLQPALDGPAYVAGAGQDTRVLLGGLLDVVNAVACIGTAVVLFPVLRRWSEARALGFVASRVMEAAIILTGVASILAVVTLRQQVASGDLGVASVQGVAAGLVEVRDWTFLLGPGLVPAVNAALFGSVLLQSRLVPRWIPMTGLVGAPLLAASAVATVLGANEQSSALSAVLTLPIFVWELSVGLWMLVKGFRDVEPPASGPVGDDAPPPARRAAATV